MNKGKITQVIGPVVDVVFEGDPLPLIKEALIVQLNGAPLCYGDRSAYGKQSGTLYRAGFQ